MHAPAWLACACQPHHFPAMLWPLPLPASLVMWWPCVAGQTNCSSAPWRLCAAPSVIMPCNARLQAEVSNKAGYLCHIHVEATFDVPPEVVYQIFTHPGEPLGVWPITRALCSSGLACCGGGMCITHGCRLDGR